MRRPTLHKDGRAKSDRWSSDPGLSKGGCATVRVSARQAPGHQQIGGILCDSCGPASPDFSWERLNPHPQFSSCRNSLWVVSRSRRSVNVVERLRSDVKVMLAREGILFERVEGDRTDFPIDFRLQECLLNAAADPEVSTASFAQGVRVGPGSRMPRCPKRYAKNRRWRISEQREQVDFDEVLATQGVSTLSTFRAEVEEVLRDQAGRRQVLIMLEAEARDRFPNLVVASLEAQKKEKPGGIISARVFFNGTNGNFVNTSTHLRDQERAPVAPDLKRLMREKAKAGEVTFGLTADVKEAHRQVLSIRMTGTCWDVSSTREERYL